MLSWRGAGARRAIEGPLVLSPSKDTRFLSAPREVNARLTLSGSVARRGAEAHRLESQPRGRRYRLAGGSRAPFLLLVGSVLALISGCNPGAYPVDLFPEMHYQPSQRRLEPDRLAPPPGAVPVTGGRQAYTFVEVTDLRNPLAREPGLARGREVFRVNCAICHGADGRGQSYVAERFAAAQVLRPVNLAEARARDRTDGQLYWLVTNGVGNMPPFADLLTENERWSLVHVIRDVQGR